MVWHSAEKFLCTLYGMLVYGPLRDLYLRGPSVGGYGFWMGKAAVDICAELTQVKSSFWHEQKRECDALIDHHVDAFVLGVVWVVAALVFYRVASGLWFRLFVVDPFLRRLDRIEESLFHHARGGSSSGSESDGGKVKGKEDVGASVNILKKKAKKLATSPRPENPKLDL